MTRRTDTIPPDYFDALYRADPDPWRFRTSAYERGKYDATLAALDAHRYRRGLEVGCAIGVLTRDLGRLCEHLLAIDVSDVALATARQHCADLLNIAFEKRMVPADFPDGPFDLIVLSEVLYYLTAADLQTAASRTVQALAPGGTILLCHWLGETDYPLTGAQATDLFVQFTAGRSLHHERLADGEYRLDRLRDARRPGPANEGAEPPLA
jgi:SAM-dependent methyltransferase